MKINSDAYPTGQYLVLMAVPIAAQLLSYPAFAHENHHHREEPSSSSTEPAQETAPVTTTDGNDTSAEVEQPAKLTTEETVAAPTAETPNSQGQLSDGFSIGLGESLLGLILVGPFLLMSLKRMCN
ncbi:MAG: hypothetical protein AAF572_26235 [Cyanobacteria bacterium P01_B01_bin.77]